MGRYDSYDDEQDDLQDDANDTSAMKQLRAADRAKAKRIKELEDRLAGFEQQSRKSTVEAVLKARDLNPKIAAIVPSDLADEASITKWIEDYADVFGTPSAAQQPTLSDQDQANLRQMDAVMAGASAPAGAEALLEQVKTMPIDQLMRLIQGESAG